MMALEQLLGKSSVYQMMKMSGQVLAELASVDLAERLVEEGLTIGTTLLKAFPYRQRPERIVVENLPLAIRDDNVIAALQPYCRVVSLTHEDASSGGYTWATGNKEAFVLLNKGRKLHQLPAKLRCVYVECCPELSRVQYVLALGKLEGGKNIIQLTKMNGHVLVGLTTKALAERLIEEGLEIEDTSLKTYPFRKRAERVIISNMPFFVEDSEVIAALKPYGQVTSIAPLLVNVAGFTMKDERRELFIV
ncbi:hypothetical protein LAZ67_X003283 [Cordylochernes scorpioides]|uniref:Uncharacterized protein n=1 Tax=Cordylochernes scorpioides TaxID=51811 RepID=A0ABY6LU18_9ARAC|nr:hypothetical protein LAZ67_X003283 [Cordylochernes scorpioides]